MKEILLTVTHSKTYQVAVKSASDVDDICDYPATISKLDKAVLRSIEFPLTNPDHELVDSSISVLEVVDVEKELWTV